MDAHKRMIVSDMLAKENWQFVVPIYQRAYKWEEADSIRLLKDIIKSGKSKKEHFVGSIVYQHEKDINLSDIKLYLVDGQQRLTTLVLITKALNLISREILAKEDNDDAKYVEAKTNKILFIDVDDKQRGYKIEPGKKDASVFTAIIRGEDMKSIQDTPLIDKSSAVYCNFLKIYDFIKEEIETGTNIKEQIYNNGMLNITAVEITLNADEDAQEIFESINSLGVALSNSDLIRNYLLMTNSKQKELYDNYWEPIEKILPDKLLESFIKDYLLMKLEYSFNDKDAYKEYQKLAEVSYKDNDIVDRAAMLEDLFKVAEIYEPFVRESKNYTLITNRLMQELRDMDQSTAYPFLMNVFLDRKNKPEIVSEETLNKTINLIITYLVRRTICGVPTNTLRSFMLTLYKRIFKVEENYNHYYESIYAFLQNISTNDYLRTQEEVKEKLITAPIYRNTRFATYLLYRLENGRYPNVYSEQISAKSTTVEHIMPQHLTEEWEQMLQTDDDVLAEDIHKLYLDTIGNLSLSSREKNSVMSDEPFDKKKEVLLTDGSKFKVLNQDIEKMEVFTQEEILKREKRLEKLVIDKYSLPEVDIEGIKFENTVAVVCTEEANQIFVGAEPVSFKLFEREVPINSFARIVVEVHKILLQRYPERIKELALSGYNPWNDDEDARKCLYYGKDEESKDTLLGENIYICTTLAANYCVQFCVDTLKECGLEPDQLMIYLKKESIRKQNTIKKAEKITMIRKALQQLSNEGRIIYDPENMPDGNSFIKFKNEVYNELFPARGVLTGWDSGKYDSIYYLEYQLSKHRVLVSVKSFKETEDLIEKFRKLNKEGFWEINDTTNWHIKEVCVDFEKVVNSPDMIQELKDQISNAVEELNLFANELKIKLI